MLYLRFLLIPFSLFFVIHPCEAIISENPSVIVKISSTDCASCMLGLEELNNLNHKVKLYFSIKNDDQKGVLVNSVSRIISRPYEVVLSDSLYYALHLSRSSFYLYSDSILLDFGHLNAFDAVKVKMLSTPYMLLTADTLAQVNEGFNDLQLTDNGDILIHNLGLNSIVYYNQAENGSHIWKGEDIDRLEIYEALNGRDTTHFSKTVLKHKDALSKYNMYHLKFESVSIIDSGIYVLATLHNMIEMEVNGDLKYVIAPELLICHFSLSNPNAREFIAINDLPKSKLKRYSIDNTQKICPLNSSEIMVPIYSEHLGRKNKIFAKYKRNRSGFYFDEVLNFELPESFVQDELVYEGNYYRIEDGLLVFIATGDYLQLESGIAGNFGLGKTILSKVNNEYQKIIDWRVEGYDVRNSLMYVYFKDQEARKMAVFNSKDHKAEVYKVPEEFTQLELGSNLAIAPNGDIYFVSKEGFLLKI